MEVFLIRHGTRNFTVGDVPLNSEGINQALELTQDDRLNGLKTLLSSPKKRAFLTLEPLSGKIGSRIEILPELDQMERGETESSFQSRVQLFLDRIEKGHWKTPMIACTHSDWLAMAMQLIPSDSQDLKYQVFQTSEYIHFAIEDGVWYLKD